VAFRNVLGRAETLQANVSFGTKTRSAFEIVFGKPLSGNVDRTLSLAVFKQTVDFTSTNSFNLSNLGGRVSLNVCSFPFPFPRFFPSPQLNPPLSL